jgi:hypothetical protein
MYSTVRHNPNRQILVVPSAEIGGVTLPVAAYMFNRIARGTRFAMDEKQLAFLLSERPVEFLTQRKFPDWRAIKTQQPISMSSIGRGGIPHDYREKRLKEIEAYHAELKSKSIDELMALYQQERAKEADELRAKTSLEEQQRFFNRPSAKADFVHWSKAAHWTLDEAIALALGKDPKAVTWERVKEFLRISPFVQRYEQVRDLALRAKAWNQLYDPVLPGIFLAWAKRSDIEVPPELLEQVEKRGIVVADWKDAYDKLKEQFDILLLDRDKIGDICKRLIQERDELKKQVVELDSLAWEGFDPDGVTYPSELDIAMQAWRAVTNRPHADLTAKAQIENWLNQNYPDRKTLSQEARERIAVICNWEKAGGRRRRETK